MKESRMFITGDTHGDWVHRLNMESFPEQRELTKDDYVIICGDFGYWHDTKEERYNLDWLDSRSFTTLFVSGNHENYDRLDVLPKEEWSGGIIQKLRPSVIHLCRGQVFTLNGQKFFTFGGASSHDISGGILERDDPRFRQKKRDLDRNYICYRVNHESWWERELPNVEEMEEGRKNLAKNNWEVDYVITHSPASSILHQMDGGAGFYKDDILTLYLQEVKEKTEFKQWFFGHMHENKNFYFDRSSCIYEQIVEVPGRNREKELEEAFCK